VRVRRNGPGEVKTRNQQRLWPRLSSALALVAYLALLFYSHAHLALEAHEHGWKAAHAAEHDHDSDDHHSPHPAADHDVATATPCLGKADQFVVHDLVTVAVLVIAPTQPDLPVGSWSEDIPKHPPPRLPEQPRSPPFV
jgi:hypothetical protein